MSKPPPRLFLRGLPRRSRHLSTPTPPSHAGIVATFVPASATPSFSGAASHSTYPLSSVGHSNALVSLGGSSYHATTSIRKPESTASVPLAKGSPLLETNFPTFPIPSTPAYSSDSQKSSAGSFRRSSAVAYPQSLNVGLPRPKLTPSVDTPRDYPLETAFFGVHRLKPSWSAYQPDDWTSDSVQRQSLFFDVDSPSSSQSTLPYPTVISWSSEAATESRHEDWSRYGQSRRTKRSESKSRSESRSRSTSPRPDEDRSQRHTQFDGVPIFHDTNNSIFERTYVRHARLVPALVNDEVTSTGQVTLFSHAAQAADDSLNDEDLGQSSSHRERQPIASRTDFRFNPGAYGIPKERHYDDEADRPIPSDSPESPFRRIVEEDQETQQADVSASVQVGEDAYFFRPEALGIADGVGGWTAPRARAARASQGEDDEKEIIARARRSRADPGLYARLLMHFCDAEIESWRRGDADWLDPRGSAVPAEHQKGSTMRATTKSSTNNVSFSSLEGTNSHRNGKTESSKDRTNDIPRRDLDPLEIMQKAYERCMEKIRAEGVFGSATCLLAVLARNELRVANMGDCAIVVVRNGEIVFRTEEMLRSFNFPIQLGTNVKYEPMKDAQVTTCKVQRGDVVIMCTDGLVDNLFDEDILEVLAQFAAPTNDLTSSGARTATKQSSASKPAFSPRRVSEALCLAAQEVSNDTAGASPFMCRAFEHGIDFYGGKKDDISVMVAVVQADD